MDKDDVCVYVYKYMYVHIYTHTHTHTHTHSTMEYYWVIKKNKNFSFVEQMSLEGVTLCLKKIKKLKKLKK